MKNLVVLFASFLLMTIAIEGVKAQSTATAEASATIITPITILKTQDLKFGNIAVQQLTGGSVVLTPGGVRNATGGVTLPTVTGDVSAASFTVSGDGNRTFSISLPTAPITLTGGAGGTMSLGTFTSTPSATGTLDAGSKIVTVGGTLTVSAGQSPGLYTNTSGLAITVNYN
jgi:hypothetical protein